MLYYPSIIYTSGAHSIRRFDDCLKLGKRIDERAYTLPNPEIICARPGDPVPIPSDRHLAGASSQASRLPTPQGSSNPLRRDSKVFQGKKVLLSSDLNIGSRLRGTIEDLIVDGGGHVTGSIHKADMLVCQFRDSEDYRIASRAGKDVGNVPWLYFVITHNVWTSPMRCLLHYPIARQGLPGFRGCRISLSNYAGEARVYLENLIRAAGGEYTKTMNVDNTHLITARAQSEKCTAAREWNIHIVNHLWLEESYARWEIQSLSNPRYSHFPTRANLGEVVGQTEIDRDAVREFFFPAEEDSESVDSDRRALRGVPEADQNTTASFQTSNGISEVGPEGDEGATSSSPNASIGDLTPKSKKTGQSHNATRSINTPLATRFTGDDKENETPRTSGSRGAKARAMARLHDLAPDMALYEKEKKRVGGVVHGGRKAAEDVVRKRASASAGEGEVESDVDMEDERAVKRQKKTRRAPFMKLVLTSYKRWSSQPRTADTEKVKGVEPYRYGRLTKTMQNQLRDLGIIIVDSPSDCTHLAAPSMIRTVKFISTLAFAPIIISTDFVDHCLSDDEVPPVKDFLLHDVETEKRLGFKLTEALERAKANKRGLLKGSKICCTPTIANGVDTFKSIVEANGGHCEVFRPRSGLTWDGGHEETGYEEKVVYLLSSESQEERKLHDKFIQAASEHDLEARVVKFDWLLDAALSQQVKWDKRYDLGSSRKA